MNSQPRRSFRAVRDREGQMDRSAEPLPGWRCDRRALFPQETPMAQLDALPRWDMTTIFPSLQSPEFTAAFEQVKQEVRALVPLFDAHQVQRRDSHAVDAPLVQAFEEVTVRLNALYRSMQTLRSYLGCFVATDARNDAAQALLSELQMAGV